MSEGYDLSKLKHSIFGSTEFLVLESHTYTGLNHRGIEIGSQARAKVCFFSILHFTTVLFQGSLQRLTFPSANFGTNQRTEESPWWYGWKQCQNR